MRLGGFLQFRIRDPKPRTIHAPCFRDRVIHHAVMAHVGPVLDRSLVADTFACREGKGTLAAVHRAQEHARRFPWFVKVDVRAYFASIEHARVEALLERRFADPRLRALLGQIVRSHEASPGRGLPIGALTSQHLANAFLGPLDRHLLEEARLAGYTRYMDDAVRWTHDRAHARASLRTATDVVHGLGLELHPGAYVQRSALGLAFLGFRIYPGVLRLSRRRQRRYSAYRRRWEDAYRRGEIGADELTWRYACALAITLHADAAAWRRAELERHPPPDV